jgi:hypothetical protein
MSASRNLEIPENPDLVPIAKLPGEWIDNYLSEGAKLVGAKIHSYAAHLQDPPHIRLVISGARREQVQRYVDSAQVVMQVTDRPGPEYENAFPAQNSVDHYAQAAQAEAGHRGASQEPSPFNDQSALPDLELSVDPEDENHEDAYYATLLTQYPERLLVTFEFDSPETSGNSVNISYTIDPPIDANVVLHYRAKAQTGATAGVSATSGSVTLNMWRWYTNNNGMYLNQSLGSQSSVAGASTGQTLQHSGYPVKSTYDVSVTGNANGSDYTISGSWVLEG